MHPLHRIVGGAVFGMLLVAGLSAPAFAQKLDNKNAGPTTAATTAPEAQIDFGDDTSEWAKDGECDDPRFTGTGSAAELVEIDILKDATDCKAAYQAGTVTLKDAPATTTTAPADVAIATPAPAAVEFGDDSSEWAKDGECDDPRFTGTGSAAELLDADILKDATDCKAAYEAGTVTLKDAPAGTTTPADVAIASPVDAIDFGDDTSEWAKDGECDDPRFAGTGSAAELIDADILKDATDCKAAYQAGTVTLKDGSTTTTTAVAEVDYGDDTSEWAKDGECDDPRFSGTGVASELLDADLGHDATDCRAAVEAGTATFGTTTPTTTTAVADFDYGGDWSKWANDGECDDPRFQGAGTDKKLLADDLAGDATDCKALETAGKVTIRTVYTPAYAAGAPYDSAAISFGDNTSSYANDDMCDDPRFEGPGAAAMLLDSDLDHDRADCQKAFEAGTVVLRDGV